MKQKKPVTAETLKVMMRRYQIVALIGLVLCIFFFWHLAHRPLSEPPALWVLMGTAISGIMLTGGIFGIALYYFFHVLHREG
ncbi:MAG TPA: hypothetical protein VNH42_00275 [Mariprofundaceae bacterium]|nr:hypothetical protein [Mariprofundaceae bacterium]